MKILWAIDVFKASGQEVQRIGRFLQLFLSKKDSYMEVAYVSSPQEVQLSLAFDVPPKERFTSYPLKLLKKLTYHCIPIAKRSHHVFYESSYSLTKAVLKLCKESKKSKPDFISIQSKSQSNLTPIIFGSFAETLIHNSTVPVLVTRPKMKFPTKIRTIVLADDLSAKSKGGRLFTARIANELGANVIVLHVDPLYSILEKETSADARKYREKINRKLSTITKTIRQEGETQYAVRGGIERTVDTILSFIDETNADCLVVSAKAGRLATLMGGSVTRGLLHKIQIPMFVYKS